MSDLLLTNLTIQHVSANCFWILAEQFGETVACPDNYAATGACGSGSKADCDGFVHKLKCCAINGGSQTNCKLKKSTFGQTSTCDYNQGVAGSCGSGGWADCNGYSNEALCCDLPNISLNHYDNYLLQGDFGQTLACEEGYVMTSLCGSGGQKDCDYNGGSFCWEGTCTGYENVPYNPENRKLIFHEKWDNFDSWLHEVTFEIFNNEFQYYRNDRRNSFVENGELTIIPTTTVSEYGDDFLYYGTLDLEGCTRGQCSKTGDYNDIIHPIQSARLISRNKFSFRYGRIEVEMKMPQGDWLWPAFWLMPENSVYGGWPTSGEIDILETRGNAGLDCNGNEAGRRCAQSTIHYGPSSSYKTFESFENCLPDGTDLTDGFHNYAFEWTPTGMHTYIDGNQVLSVDAPFHGFFEKGGFQGDNPWENGSDLAPFDQEFYIIINLAVGGDYFPDGCWNSGGIQKPWNFGQDGNSMRRSYWWGGKDYRNEDHESLASWGDSRFVVKEIKVFDYQ